MSPISVYQNIYMEGTVMDYKLAWVDESNKKILHSKMFATFEEAINESVRYKDYFLFKLNTMDSGEYSWDLLPYGMSSWYIFGLNIKDHLPLILIVTGSILALSVLIRSSSHKNKTELSSGLV